MVSMVVTGILWTLLDLKVAPSLKPHFRDIRAVHFGSLYLVPWFLGLAYAFDRLKIPEWHQAFFPIGLGALSSFLAWDTCFRPAHRFSTRFIIGLRDGRWCCP